MTIIEKIINAIKLFFGFEEKKIVKLDGNLDLVIEDKEVIVEEFGTQDGEGRGTEVETLSASPKKKAKKVTKKKTSKKKAGKKKKASKKKSSKKKEK